MRTLLIRQIGSSDQARFQVVRLRDGKCTDNVLILSPAAVPVKSRPGSNLLSELRWYQEGFLDYPFHPETDHAECVLDALRQWGLAAFAALFGSMHGRDWFKDATRRGHERLRLVVSSDDPRILSWPWEALRDPETDVLALSCQIERKLNQIADPLPLSDKLPQDRINILLVTARPFERDVGYRSISRPLVELIETLQLPATVTLLRPPTLDQLLGHLRAHPDTYHILHFDGHGGYGEAANIAGDRHRLQGAKGQLVFETEDGQPDYVPADQLGILLREHRIPAVVLNACQSAMLDDQATDPFASVAAALLRAGVRSVVAMSYSLYVSGAQQFLPAFYRRLFETGSVTEAVRSGRQQMFREQGRACPRGSYNLQDWLVPVTYAQEAVDFHFVTSTSSAPSSDESTLPEEARDTKNPYGFIGRDGALLALERAMRRPPPGILIRGLAGAGKTTLVRGFIHWRRQTAGIGNGCFWFTFSEIRSAEFIFNEIGMAFYGDSFIPVPTDQKVKQLSKVLREHPFIIVWDNFESARGIEGTPMVGLLSHEDQQLIRSLLAALRGGKTKVLITSRSDEEWLGSANRYNLPPLGGLQGEERWEFCRIILRDLGKTITRNDPNLIKLMDALDGHPLMMRVVLPRLEENNAAMLLEVLRGNIGALGLKGDEIEEKLQATLLFATQALPKKIQPLLTPLSLFDRYVSADFFEKVAGQVSVKLFRSQIDQLLGILGQVGLLLELSPGCFDIHPALTGYLRESTKADSKSTDDWARSFVDVMCMMMKNINSHPLQLIHGWFHFNEGSVYSALDEADRLRMDRQVGILIKQLGFFAQRSHNFVMAKVLLTRLAEHQHKCNNEREESIAYHHLGIIAQHERNFVLAEKLLHKSLEISVRIGDEYCMSMTYYHLGRIAQECQDIDAAEVLYRKCLEINERKGYKDFLGNTYYELGNIASVRGDFDCAMEWFEKGHAIKDSLGDESGVASGYQQLAVIAYKLKNIFAAEALSQKCLVLFEKCGDEHGAATAYHLNGLIAQDRKDWVAAETWYKKSLEINERFGDKYAAAGAIAQLGSIATYQGRFEEGAKWLLKSLELYSILKDTEDLRRVKHNYLHFYKYASKIEQLLLQTMWEEAGMGPFPLQ